MTNQEIETKLELLVTQERKITRDILKLINLAEDRRLHLSAGCDSLVRWLIVRFKYSEAAAIRRVQSARLMRAVPAIDQKIQTGEVTLTTLAKTQSILRAEEKRTGKKLTKEDRHAAVAAIENCTQEQTEKKLAELFPETMEQVKKQNIRLTANGDVRLSLTFAENEYKDLLRTKDLLGHTIPESNLAEVINHLVGYYLKKMDPQRQSKVPESLRRQVIRRDGGKCQFVDPRTGHKCESTKRIEVDHIQPRALGGTDDISNLRCLCRTHNAFRAEQTFGKFKYAH